MTMSCMISGRYWHGLFASMWLCCFFYILRTGDEKYFNRTCPVSPWDGSQCSWSAVGKQGKLWRSCMSWQKRSTWIPLQTWGCWRCLRVVVSLSPCVDTPALWSVRGRQKNRDRHQLSRVRVKKKVKQSVPYPCRVPPSTAHSLYHVLCVGERPSQLLHGGCHPRSNTPGSSACLHF